ncbi:D-glycero-beta-D-manno-heptose-7-phosphate kinase [Candidatus Tachikawaea gelatinosa]|uniref:Bifunctional protein HldE n=1 Tax=Candidatus Tachikawaea gelatinosa TaxID=1410383 RepID=A0A090AQC9_9ENTR|nr:D-glycero-beta-D-manno-heptose-7-phosphate kinase [Candidatus Tachikawaea gelatinosa]BAP58557.1 bifunctional protein HldE [Candidatus Tachikawaea gelatinosa]
MPIKLPSFHNIRIITIGDIILDLYWSGNIKNKSSETASSIVKIKNVEERPGGAANVAMNIASLNAKSHLIGIIGDDDSGEILKSKLLKNNVFFDYINIKSNSTIKKLRIIANDKQLIRVDFEKKFENTNNLQLINKKLIKILKKTDVLILSDYDKGTLLNVQEIIKIAKIMNVPILIDPKGNDFNKYCGATILTPNLFEFEIVSGKCKTEKELINRGMEIIFNCKLSALLITRAESGMTLLQKHKMPVYYPAQTQEVLDVTGAGDTVISVIAAILATGSSLEEACFFSNIAAGIVVNKVKTSTITLVELQEAINLYQKSNDNFSTYF